MSILPCGGGSALGQGQLPSKPRPCPQMWHKTLFMNSKHRHIDAKGTFCGHKICQMRFWPGCACAPLRVYDVPQTPLVTKGRVFILCLYTAFSLKALRHGSHSFTCKLHHACFAFVSVHHWCGGEHLIAAHYSFIDLRGWKAELAGEGLAVWLVHSKHGLEKNIFVGV